MTARITFAIPFYGGIGYLNSALRSLQSQTLTEWKAIVVDDAGPESADELVARLVDPRIRYVRNDTNLGLAGNWNKAMLLADTEFVTLFHCDDELEPHYADTMIGLMDRHPRVIAGHCVVYLMDENGQPTRTLADTVKSWLTPRFTGDHLTSGDEGLQSLLRANWIFCPTLCYRREVLGEPPFEVKWRFVPDLAFLADALLKGYEVVGTGDIAYRYRRHGLNQTSQLTRELTRFDEELQLYGELVRLASSIGWRRSASTARRAVVLRLHLVVTAIQSLIRGDLGRFRKALRLVTKKVVSREWN